MNVAIPLEIIDSLEMTGCQYYAWHLIRELSKHNGLDLTAIVSNRTPLEILPRNIKTRRHHQLRMFGAVFFNSLVHPLSGLSNYDIIHCPTVVTPFFFKPKTAVIITVHDLVPLIHPYFSTIRHRVYFRYFVGRQISEADHLIAVSNSTKRDIIHFYDQPSDKITVVPEGVGEEFRPISSPKEDYVLSVATLEPRKNFKGLIEAFIQMKQRTKVSTRLLLAGREGWKHSNLFRIPNEYKSDVLFLGYVSSQDLIKLYQRALAFIYPSFYEGFGLPVLEAMACGCPVVASNRASLPEVAGQSCLYVNPERTGEIADALSRILTDDSLANELSARGLERAKLFTWGKCARLTKEIYCRIG